jgi:alkyldihydroxyacetonephosphate synthase
VLDLTAMQGIIEIDAVSGLTEVWAGTFGPELETELRQRCAMTIGHFPQSFDIATVGGWVACRGAGQFSTRYGKIDEMVVGLEVVLADGTVVHTGHGPAAAMGPDLTQLFLGSEGTLGVITRVWLRAHPVPTHERRAAFTFADFETGIEACRLILRRGATPAVLRLYDAVESQRGHGGDGSQSVLLVLDEGDIGLVEATFGVVEDECAAAALASVDLVERWLIHRNDTDALQELTRKGFVVDTMEIAAPW